MYGEKEDSEKSGDLEKVIHQVHLRIKVHKKDLVKTLTDQKDRDIQIYILEQVQISSIRRLHHH